VSGRNLLHPRLARSCVAQDPILQPDRAAGAVDRGRQQRGLSQVQVAVAEPRGRGCVVRGGQGVDDPGARVIFSQLVDQGRSRVRARPSTALLWSSAQDAWQLGHHLAGRVEVVPGREHVLRACELPQSHLGEIAEQRVIPRQAQGTRAVHILDAGQHAVVFPQQVLVLHARGRGLSGRGDKRLQRQGFGLGKHGPLAQVGPPVRDDQLEQDRHRQQRCHRPARQRNDGQDEHHDEHRSTRDPAAQPCCLPVCVQRWAQQDAGRNQGGGRDGHPDQQC